MAGGGCPLHIGNDVSPKEGRSAVRSLPDIAALLRQDEGQYFERKSLWAGAPGHKRPRERRQVRDQIAEQVAAFANADGGTLLLGVEDNGTVRGTAILSRRSMRCWPCPSVD